MIATSANDRSSFERCTPRLSADFFLRIFQDEATLHNLAEKHRLVHCLNIPSQDWSDFDWHAREARYFNQLHDNRHRALRRLYRPQGKINRLLIIAANKALDITRKITIACQRGLPLGSNLSGIADLRKQLPDCVQLVQSASISLDNARIATKPLRETNAFQTRLSRNQLAFNAHLLATLRSIAVTQTMLKKHLLSSPDTACWNHISWHLVQLDAILINALGSRSLIRRLRTPQYIVNNYFSVILEQMVSALQLLNTATQAHLESTAE